MGVGTLVNYVEAMQGVFLTGNLPGAIAPIKIYAGHDVITASEIRGTILKMAEGSVY